MAIENVDEKERRIMDIEAMMVSESSLSAQYAGKDYTLVKHKNGEYVLYKGYKEIYKNTNDEENPSSILQMPSMTITLDEALNIVKIESTTPGRTMGQQTVYDIVDKMIVEEVARAY
jgi:hypothetical protein